MKKAENHLNISHVCQLMDVPIASYYYHSTVKLENAQHLDVMRVIHKENLQTYGRRRMKVALEEQGIQLGIFRDCPTNCVNARDTFKGDPSLDHQIQ